MKITQDVHEFATKEFIATSGGNLPEQELISALAKHELPSALADGLQRSRTRLEPNKQRINQIPNSIGRKQRARLIIYLISAKSCDGTRTLLSECLCKRQKCLGKIKLICRLRVFDCFAIIRTGVSEFP